MLGGDNGFFTELIPLCDVQPEVKSLLCSGVCVLREVMANTPTPRLSGVCKANPNILGALTH